MKMSKDVWMVVGVVVGVVVLWIINLGVGFLATVGAIIFAISRWKSEIKKFLMEKGIFFGVTTEEIAETASVEKKPSQTPPAPPTAQKIEWIKNCIAKCRKIVDENECLAGNAQVPNPIDGMDQSNFTLKQFRKLLAQKAHKKASMLKRILEGQEEDVKVISNLDDWIKWYEQMILVRLNERAAAVYSRPSNEESGNKQIAQIKNNPIKNNPADTTDNTPTKYVDDTVDRTLDEVVEKVNKNTSPTSTNKTPKHWVEDIFPPAYFQKANCALDQEDKLQERFAECLNNRQALIERAMGLLNSGVINGYQAAKMLQEPALKKQADALLITQ